MTPGWNPAVEDRATDRAHRIGQDKPVFVHRLIVNGSIEQRRWTCSKQRKQAVAAGILGASTTASPALSEADLAMLFAPPWPGRGRPLNRAAQCVGHGLPIRCAVAVIVERQAAVLQPNPGA